MLCLLIASLAAAQVPSPSTSVCEIVAHPKRFVPAQTFRQQMVFHAVVALCYSFDSTKVANQFDLRFLRESWSTLEQLERAERRNRRQK